MKRNPTPLRTAAAAAPTVDSGERDHASIAKSLSMCLSDTNERIDAVTEIVNAANGELSELFITKESLERALHTNEPRATYGTTNKAQALR